LLIDHFFQTMSLKSAKTIEGVHEETMELLMNYRWPGNVRELKGTLEYALVTCHSGPICPNHLPETISRKHTKPPAPKKTGLNLHEIERQELLEALEKTGGNQSQAAKLLGISRVTVWNRMKRFNIQAKRDFTT
jgi:transcriptional regulator with PAS, ATPase and Fis domain